MIKDMKAALGTVLFSVLWLLFAMFCISSVATAQTYRDVIVKKDGAANAALFDDAIKVNIRPELRAKLAPYVSAIRYAENGRAGREYGCLSKYAKDRGYRRQAGECACTVQKNYDRWVKAGSKGEFVVFLGKRYCPVGADNDPNGLNKHWIKNVRKLYAKHSR
tara:strand:+ start:486 stop:974 length:489 start_codon:yes stop_codon:yes gene_type:complete